MSHFDLAGRVAVVTGGNGGIGLGMARGLARAGAAVAVAARKREKSLRAVDELEALGAPAAAFEVDVTDEAAVAALVQAVVERFGRLDILVNNAGINIRKPPQDLALAEWRQVLDTNLTSAFLVSRAVYPVMKAQGGGKIINIGSMMSIFLHRLRPRLWGLQGRHRSAHEGDGLGLGPRQYPGERGAARLDRHRSHGASAAGDPRPQRERAGAHAGPAVGGE